MYARQFLAGSLMFLALLAWGAALHAAVANAYAQPAGLADGHDYSTVCPPRPGDAAAGSDAALIVSTTAEQEAADACVRAEQLSVQTRAEADRAHTDAAAIASDLAGFTAAHPLAVAVQNWAASPSTSTVEFGPQAQAQLDGNTDAMRADWWYFAGLALGVVVAFIFWRRAAI